MTITTILLIAIFLAFFSLVLGLGFWLTRDKSLGRRLDQLQDEHIALDQALGDDKAWHVKVVRLAAPFARLSAPKEGGDASYLRIRFFHAGLRQVYWPAIFFISKLLLALLLPVVLLLYGGMSSGGIIRSEVLLSMFLLVGVGYYLPNWVLAVLVQARQREIEEALPDAIDLMTVCVEAGLAIDAAMKRTCDELYLRSPALAEELALVTLELQVGASRESAMHNLSLRTGVEDVATFVTILLQSEHFGTNVADSLRTLSDTMRDNRRIRAEEQAAKIPLKLLFPVIFFIFPALFVVLLGPAMISIFRTLLPTLGGGQ
jgi:tight adherence protein C